MPPKSRSATVTAPLREQPEEVQREIMAMLEEKTPAQGARALKGRGLVSTPGEISEFQSWRQLRGQFRQWEEDTRTLMELLHVQQPTLSEEELERYGNAVFQTQAIKLQDASVFTRLAAARQRALKEERQLELRREQLRLQREKFEFDAAAACEKHLPELRAITDDEEADLDEKIQRIRRRLFGSAADKTASKARKPAL